MSKMGQDSGKAVAGPVGGDVGVIGPEAAVPCGCIRLRILILR